MVLVPDDRRYEQLSNVLFIKNKIPQDSYLLADEQFNELNEHIKQLEAENQYLKKLLDDAGIPYDGTDKAPEKMNRM